MPEKNIYRYSFTFNKGRCTASFQSTDVESATKTFKQLTGLDAYEKLDIKDIYTPNL